MQTNVMIVIKNLKDNNKEEPVELIDLPTDMIDVITSLLLLKEIIQTQKSCKLLHQICKLNTNELIIYKRNNKFTKYLEYYNNNSNDNKIFRFKHIKRLKIIFARNSYSHNSFCKHFQLINPIIKYHRNLSYCEINEISSGMVTDCLNSYIKFCDNIVKYDISIHYLEFDYCTVVDASTKLLSQAVDRVKFHYVNINLNYKFIEALNHSKIKHLNANNIYVITNTLTENEISFSHFNTLQSLSATLHNSYLSEEDKKFIQSLISQSPNLKFITIDPSHCSFKWINKISKSVKTLTLRKYFFQRYFCQEFVEIHKDHKFDQIILKCMHEFDYCTSSNCDAILLFIAEIIMKKNFVIKMEFDFDLSELTVKVTEAIENREEFVVGCLDNTKQMSNEYDDIYYILEFKGCNKDGKVHVNGTYPDAFTLMTEIS